MSKARGAGSATVQPARKIAPADLRQWLVVGCILLLTLVVYAQVAHFPFAPIDDPDYVADAASRIVPIHQSVNGYVSTGLGVAGAVIMVALSVLTMPQVRTWRRLAGRA